MRIQALMDYTVPASFDGIILIHNAGKVVLSYGDIFSAGDPFPDLGIEFIDRVATRSLYEIPLTQLKAWDKEQ